MAKKKAKDEEEEVVAVGPGVEDETEEEEEQETPKKKVAPVQDEGDEDDEEDQGEEKEDERVGEAEAGSEDGEEDREGKRESRKARRERQRRARQRNELELGYLRQRNEVLEKRMNEISQRQQQSEVGNLDQRIAGLQSQLKVADDVLAKAITAGQGEDAAEAQGIRDKIRDNLQRLNIYKNEMGRRAQEESQTTPDVDPRLVSHAQNWISDNRWYDPNGGDRESRIVTSIDNRLVQEGYDPRTEEYWDELTERVKSRLPHRFKNGKDNGKDELEEEETPTSRREERRSTGPRFSVGGRERPLRKNEVYVSAERKQALQEAGVWDDPVLRQKYLKRYAAWDRENPRGRSAR